jgi:hypothetical protein
MRITTGETTTMATAATATVDPQSELHQTVTKVARRPRPYGRTGSSHAMDMNTSNGSNRYDVSIGGRCSWLLSPIRHESRI